ncbi:hypothetical protein Tsubulata_003746 [Turnera subulata]|uniref:Zinc knuckle CX2CX4HX4C domain-containing protein n=1 Tax=Turnera subulata TaxID=218843 RepID=A0A9Q0JFV4_9ROSI|nr:hypothetical protein Tsubulata_003746 [Turnera subulata]
MQAAWMRDVGDDGDSAQRRKPTEKYFNPADKSPNFGVGRIFRNRGEVKEAFDKWNIRVRRDTKWVTFHHTNKIWVVRKYPIKKHDCGAGNSNCRVTKRVIANFLIAKYASTTQDLRPTQIMEIARRKFKVAPRWGQAQDTKELIRTHFKGRMLKDYVSRWYHKDMFMKSYRLSLNPVPGEVFWESSDRRPIHPPLAEIKRGRPQTKRRTEWGKKKNRKASKTDRVMQCQQCLEFGHISPRGVGGSQGNTNRDRASQMPNTKKRKVLPRPRVEGVQNGGPLYLLHKTEGLHLMHKSPMQECPEVEKPQLPPISILKNQQTLFILRSDYMLPLVLASSAQPQAPTVRGNAPSHRGRVTSKNCRRLNFGEGRGVLVTESSLMVENPGTRSQQIIHVPNRRSTLNANVKTTQQSATATITEAPTSVDPEIRFSPAMDVVIGMIFALLATPPNLHYSCIMAHSTMPSTSTVSTLRMRRNNRSRPEPEGVMHRDAHGREVWIAFRYEDIDLICYTCGLVSHKASHCILPRCEKQGVLLDDPTSYGHWMFAHSLNGEYFLRRVQPVIIDLDWDGDEADEEIVP